MNDAFAFHGAIYQMIHRAASATEAGRNPSVAYFCFKMKSLPKVAKIEKVVKQLTELWNLLGQPSTFPFFVVEIEIKATEVYEKMQREAKTKSMKELPESVISALQGKQPLFEFSPKPIIRIDGSVAENTP